jgi:hypothetical protein
MCMEAACRHSFLFVCLYWYDTFSPEGPSLHEHVLNFSRVRFVAAYANGSQRYHQHSLTTPAIAPPAVEKW